MDQNATILVVDDISENIFIIEKILSSLPARVVGVSSGSEALQFLENNECALIVCDVAMPEMDGMEFAAILRERQSTAEIPLLFLTSFYHSSDHVMRGYQLGAVDYLCKPVDSKILRSKISVLLQLYLQKKKIIALKEQAECAKAIAEQANKEKDLFLARMSHEFRTPLTSISGFSELLESPNLSASDQFTYLRTIKRNTNHLVRLVDELLNLAKFSDDEFEVNVEQLDLQAEIEEICIPYRHQALQKGVHFNVSYVTAVPEVVNCDPVLFRQPLQKVLDNAVKYTEIGQVDVAVSFHESSKVLEFSIADTGCGIDLSDQKKIFKPFSKADQSMARRSAGAGLGLPLAQRIAVALGGNIEIRQSSPTRGSIFVITLKIEIPDFALRVSPRNSENSLKFLSQKGPSFLDISGVRILLAEDTDDTAFLIERILRYSNATVHRCRNGMDAVQAATTGQFDIVLMDIQMPEMDGYAATTMLRQSGYRKPIVALTAHALEGDRQNCYQAGCDDYVAKPVNAKDLTATVVKWVKRVGVVLPVAKDKN